MVCGLPISPHPPSVTACALDELGQPSGGPSVERQTIRLFTCDANRDYCAFVGS